MQYPFDVRRTTREKFVDDEKNVREVSMMHQRHTFPYANITKLMAEVLELPYADRYSMLVLLPWQNTNINEVLERLRRNGIEQTIQQLYIADSPMIDVSMPHFAVTGDFTLNVMLEQMGLIDIFNSTAADMSKISIDPIFLSRIIHRTSVTVSEYGGIVRQQSLQKRAATEEPADVWFTVNRPFIFLIVERYTNSMLFCGTVRNPGHV